MNQQLPRDNKQAIKAIRYKIAKATGQLKEYTIGVKAAYYTTVIYKVKAVNKQEARAAYKAGQAEWHETYPADYDEPDELEIIAIEENGNE